MKRYISIIQLILIFFIILTNEVYGVHGVTEDTPNILFILIDDLGREVLQPYGGPSYVTPNIDKISQKGIRFNNVYASPVCHPTRISFMSGRYPFNLNYPEWGKFPGWAEKQTVANELKKAGYKTVIAGKWQLNILKDDPEQPNRLGFDKYCLWGWREGPRYWDPHIWQNGKLRDDVHDKYGPDVYSDFLINFITENKNNPMFVVYSMTLCHDVSNDLETPPPYAPDKNRYENFYEMVSNMDLFIGKIINALDTIRPKNKTLVIVTSDNGTNSRSIIKHENGEFLRENVISKFQEMNIKGGKGTLTDWGCRVPMFIFWHGENKNEKICNDLIDFTDFLPTFLELAGLPSTEYSIDGTSFAGLLTNNHFTSREWAYCERNNQRYLLRTKNWKIISNGNLFYLPKDKYEEHPFSSENDTPKSANARKYLEQILDQLKN